MSDASNGKVRYSVASQNDTKDHEAEIQASPTKENRTCCQKLAFYSCWIGFIFILMGFICAFIMKPVVEKQILANLPIEENSQIFKGWANPQVTPVSYIYIFNLTNEKAFLEGREQANLVELGPYAYRQKISKTDIEFTSSDSIRYTERRMFQFDPQLSALPESDMVIVPNVPLFGAMHAMKSESGFAKTVFKDLLNSYDFAKDTGPFLRLSVRDFVWGYPSLLLSLNRNNGLECRDSDDMKFEQDWDDFNDWEFDYDDSSNEIKKSRPNKEEKRDCDLKPGNLDMFGIFRTRNASNNDPREVNTGSANLTERGLMISWHNMRRLNYWGDIPSKCNVISSSRDPGLLPLNLQKGDVLPLFIGDLGRTLNFKYSHEVKVESISTYRFVPREDTFDNPIDTPSNLCYCVRGVGKCLPTGMIDLSTAFEGSPILVSWPHFLYGDPELRSAVHGMKPNSSKHVFFFDVEPTYGITLAALAKFQMNVELVRDSGFGYFDNIPQDRLFLPFMWLEEGINGPTEQISGQVQMLLKLPTELRHLSALICMCVGVLLLLPEIFFWARSCCKSPNHSKEEVEPLK